MTASVQDRSTATVVEDGLSEEEKAANDAIGISLDDSEPSRIQSKHFKKMFPAGSRGAVAHMGYDRLSSPQERKRFVYYVVVTRNIPAGTLDKSIKGSFERSGSNFLHKCERARLEVHHSSS